MTDQAQITLTPKIVSTLEQCQRCFCWTSFDERIVEWRKWLGKIGWTGHFWRAPEMRAWVVAAFKPHDDGKSDRAVVWLIGDRTNDPTDELWAEVFEDIFDRIERGKWELVREGESVEYFEPKNYYKRMEASNG